MKLPQRQADAERHLRQAIALVEPLAASSASCQQLLVQSFHVLGYQLQWQNGRAGEAEDAYRRCLQLSPGLQSELDQRMTFATVSNSLGLLLRQTGRPRQAVEAHESALGFLGKTGELTGREYEAENERARAHFHMAAALWNLEQRTQAIEHERTALASWRRQAADHPLLAKARIELAGTCNDLGRMLELAGEKRESEAVYREGLEMAEQFAAGSAESADSDRLRITLNFNLGRLLLATGREKEAGKLLDQIVKLEPSSAAELNDLAWLLTTFSEPRMHNPARAVVLAGRAVERAPQEGLMWNTLGVAHFRSGQDREAKAALEKSMELRSGGDSYDWYFLAQIYVRLGDREQAMHWYNEAVAWMNKNKSGDDELLRFHAEAAAALGLKPAP
jgi:tetratricopeptide (TPR) repeat protein